MKLYVEAKSKADLIRRLAAGEEISGYNYSMFGGGGHYMLDDNLEDGTIIAIYTKKVRGNPVAKAWGTWTNKVLKAESFEAMSLDENDTIICDQCNKNVEGDSIYADFTLKCYCGNILYEDNSYGPFDITDYYGAESFAAPNHISESDLDDMLYSDEQGVWYKEIINRVGDNQYKAMYFLYNEDLEYVGKSQFDITADTITVSNIMIKDQYKRKNYATALIEDVMEYWDDEPRKLDFSDAVTEEGRAFIEGWEAESFSGEWVGEKPFQEYIPDRNDAKIVGVVALTGVIVGWFINNQLLRKK